MLADAPKYDYKKSDSGKGTVKDLKTAKKLTEENALEMVDFINNLGSNI